MDSLRQVAREYALSCYARRFYTCGGVEVGILLLRDEIPTPPWACDGAAVLRRLYTDRFLAVTATARRDWGLPDAFAIPVPDIPGWRVRHSLVDYDQHGSSYSAMRDVWTYVPL